MAGNWRRARWGPLAVLLIAVFHCWVFIHASGLTRWFFGTLAVLSLGLFVYCLLVVVKARRIVVARGWSPGD